MGCACFLVTNEITCSWISKFENSLRRHNHVGLMHALLLELAKAGKLDEAKQKARTAMEERTAREKNSRMDEA